MRPQDQYYSTINLSTPAYNVIRVSGSNIRERASRYFSGRLLDIGCGTKAKTLLVGEFVDDYIGIDHINCHHDQTNVDVFATAYQIPFKNESFDCTLGTAVLEHFDEPLQVLDETYRILKDGGYAIFTIPLFWHIHEAPRDFFRYTRYGIESLFKKSGFKIIEITPMSGFWLTFGTEFNYYLTMSAKSKTSQYFANICARAINLIIPFLEKALRKDSSFTWMYIVVARK